MGMTTTQYLDSLLQAFTPSPTEFDAARGHRKTIEARLKDDLGAYSLIETGSLSHGTAVSRASDADYFAWLPGPKPSARRALEMVRNSLNYRFSSTNFRVSSPAVVCTFASTARSVEIIPAFMNGDYSYSIPDPQNGEWMESNPKNHLEYVSNVNAKHNGQVKKMIRLLKAWKYQKNVPISSFYLEMRGAKHSAEQSTFIILWDLCLTLETMASNGLASMNDPTKTGPRFNACSTEYNRSIALSKTQTAAAHARKALDAYRANHHNIAISELKLLFGL
jgi:hypothetical protein